MPVITKQIEVGEDGCLTIRAAAAYTDHTAEDVRRAIREGKMVAKPRVGAGKLGVVPLEDLDRWVASIGQRGSNGGVLFKDLPPRAQQVRVVSKYARQHPVPDMDEELETTLAYLKALEGNIVSQAV